MGVVGVRALLEIPDADGGVGAARDEDAAVEALEGEGVHAGLVGPEGGDRAGGSIVVGRVVAAYARLAAVEAEVRGWSEGAQELGRLEAGEGVRSEVAGRPLEQELIHASGLCWLEVEGDRENVRKEGAEFDGHDVRHGIGIN